MKYFHIKKFFYIIPNGLNGIYANWGRLGYCKFMCCIFSKTTQPFDFIL